jgi:NAD(P)-dependent dehydrogenase (short-subunit alcohol dehydrogenase family)
METGLDGAAVCVVGGSQGMGLETARAFGRERARVAVMARGRANIDRALEIVDADGALPR